MREVEKCAQAMPKETAEKKSLVYARSEKQETMPAVLLLSQRLTGKCMKKLLAQIDVLDAGIFLEMKPQTPRNTFSRCDARFSVPALDMETC